MITTRRLRTQHAEYVHEQWNGANESGFRPTGDRVLILTDLPADVTSGNVYIPDDLLERQRFGAQTGTLIACGPDAFVWNSDRTRRLEGDVPKPGNRVYIEPYAGQMVPGKDGRTYRICDDKSVGAVEMDEAR